MPLDGAFGHLGLNRARQVAPACDDAFVMAAPSHTAPQFKDKPARKRYKAGEPEDECQGF